MLDPFASTPSAAKGLPPPLPSKEAASLLERLNEQSAHLGRKRAKGAKKAAVEVHSTTKAKTARPKKAQVSMHWDRRHYHAPEVAPELKLRGDQLAMCE